MNPKATFIFNYLDQPPRILYWPVNHFFGVLGPILLGIVLHFYILGMMVALFMAYVIRLSKKHDGSHFISGYLYWVLPHTKDKFPVTPPSYIREFIG